ncbi:MAG TPA: ATP12 family protein [Azospirillaceae bacterium]|nr:ATP12 family protein [Azospirillaceae bacterium]
MKRVYKQVAVAEVEGGWGVTLDGRPLPTPAKLPLVLPSRALAGAIAAEWDAQADEVKPQDMPMMQLASTALDRVGPQRQAILEGVAAYGASDLLCYRADHPRELHERQAREWQPLLDWAALRYDALLHATSGIVHKAQPEDSLKALRGALDDLDTWQLTGVQNATALCGSIVLALALFEDRIDAGTAFDLAELDASFQIERWGEDAEATARRASLRADLEATGRFLALLKAA